MRYHQAKSDYRKFCGPIDDFQSKRILDLLSADATLALGLRLLRADYKGPIVRLRRDSDNAEEDFYPMPDIGILNPGEIKSFKGTATSLRVAHWFDQSKNTNVSYEIGLKNPEFTFDGLLGKPSVYFAGGNKYLNWMQPVSFVSGSPYTSMYLGKKDSASDYLICWSGAGTTYGSAMACQNSSSQIEETGYDGRAFWNYGTTLTEAAIVGSKRTSANILTHYVNHESNTTGSFAKTLVISMIGYRPTVNYLCKGHISEAYLFSTDLSDIDRTTLRDTINAHFGVY